MKIYCIATDCPKKPAIGALCTGLMNTDDCPKVQARKRQGWVQLLAKKDCKAET